jgi:hypothetical protein
METEGSLSCAQDLGIGFCPEPDESSLHPHNLFDVIVVLIIIIPLLSTTP